MRFSTLSFAAFLLLVLCLPLSCQITTSPTVPEAVGFDIHFTNPRPGEMKMLAASGVRWVRMDFLWDHIERSPGQYDFAEYDRLLRILEAYDIRPLFILGYTNRLYDGGLSPHSNAGREAFARWVAASVRHFQGHGILWEMYNEPNWAASWSPRPNVDDYIRLALAVGEAIQENAPGETYIGPASAVIDPPFLESCFKAGLLNYWSAVSVHPYRQTDPETVARDFRNLRLMIARYAPEGKQIPIISGEWGYSSVWPRMDEQKQGQMLAREWLTNLSNGIPLSIWYDWHDDGSDPKNPEHHFGTTAARYQANGDPVYPPKSAYLAARALLSFFKDDRFSKRLAVGSPDDYVLLFGNGARTRLAVWTTSSAPHEVVVPASPGTFDAVGLTGQKLASLQADWRGLRVHITSTPEYLAPQQPNRLLQLALAWRAMPLEVHTRAPGNLTLALRLRNPFAQAISVRVGSGGWRVVPPGAVRSLTAALDNRRRSVDPLPWRIDLEARGLGRLSQVTEIVVSDPLRATLLPAAGGILPVALANPSGEAFAGSIEVTGSTGLSPRGPERVELHTGETGAFVRLSLRARSDSHYRAGLRIRDRQGNTVLTVPVMRFVAYPAPSTPDEYRLATDGDSPSCAGTGLEIADPPEGPPTPGARSLKVTYRFAPGCKVLRVVPNAGSLRAIEGGPRALGVWIHSDGETCPVFVRFADATGQIFQEGGGSIGWKGWRYVSFLLDAARASHWAGANDGVVHYPIHWNSSFVLVRPGERDSEGVIYLSGFTLIY